MTTDKLTKMKQMMANNPPPEPFYLEVEQKSDNGVTIYKPLVVRFAFESKFDDIKWTIYGDFDAQGNSNRYWKFDGVDGAEKIHQWAEAEVQLMERIEKGKVFYECLSIKWEDDEEADNPVVGIAKKVCQEVAQEYIDEQEKKKATVKPAGGIGKDDQVPAVWMLPREYHEQANEKQRKSIEMQVAVKAYTEFCSTDYATDEDRTILRNILEKMIGSELWIIPTTETSDETKNETK